jgi:hypothetical protein
MFNLLVVIGLWLLGAIAFTRLCLADPRGYLELVQFMLSLGIWAVGFFIIVWLTPIAW